MKIAGYNFDDEMIEQTRIDRLPRFTVYRIDGIAVVLGRGSDFEVELDLDAVSEDGVAVLRRHGGGCAVVLDPGNVIVSVALPAKGFGKIREYFDLLSDWMLCSLGKAGVKGVRREGICDLVLSDRKIAGASMQRKPDYVYYTASILVDPDIELMDRYLKHPPREPGYRKNRIHSDFVGSLRDLAGVDDVEKFKGEMGKALDLDTLLSMDARKHGILLECLNDTSPPPPI